MTSVVFPCRGIRCTGPGCLGTFLAKGPSLCLSTHFFDLADSPEGSRGGPQGVGGSFILAHTTLVPVPTESVSQCPMASYNQDGFSVSVGGNHLAPQYSTLQNVAEATEKPEQQLTRFSDSVRYTILSARAPFTCKYENRWHLFSQWCSAPNEDPVSCVIPTILDFLQSFLDKG